MSEHGKALTIGVRVQSGVARLHATLAALRTNSGRPFRLVLVPDGPDEEMIGVLRQMREPHLSSPEARGAGDCLARLVAAAETPIVAFLEAGALVGPGWLDRLLAALDRDPAAALVGPSTNCGPQAVDTDGSSTAAAIARAAKQIAGWFGDGVVMVAPPGALDGFCLVGRRDALAEAGVSTTPTWTAELNARLAERGRCSLWVRGAFVHQVAPFPSLLAFPRTRLRAPAITEATADPPPRPAWPHVPRPPAAIVAASSTLRVTCIMPTRDRRAFIPGAIVVDDGADPVGDLVESVPGARYLRLPARASIGEKRNLACRAARGAIVAQWDDDDFYAADRLSYQCGPIVSGSADITGLENRYVLQLPEGRFWTATAQVHRRMFVGDIHGGTLVYRRSLVERGAVYPHTSLAEDAAFLRAAVALGARLTRLPNPGVFVYVRHGRNAWQFEPGRFVDARGWSLVEPPAQFTGEHLQAYRTALASFCSSRSAS